FFATDVTSPTFAVPILLCSRSFDHFHLHTFPTRRSSDLRQVRRTAETISESDLSRRIDITPNSRDDVARLAVTFNGMLDRLERADRKSTRLNSSHVSISYAVFCLKKKKILLLNIS